MRKKTGAINRIRKDTVSYTHLDVYKRQEQGSIKAGLDKFNRV